MPGEKVEAETVVGGSFEEGFNPVVVKTGSGRAADFVDSIVGPLGDSFGSLEIENGIGGGAAIVPAAEEVGFVPDLVVNIGNIFFNTVAAGGGRDELKPDIPIFGLPGVLAVFAHIGGGIGEGEEGGGAGK